jgi:hypothetical protein
MRTVGTLAICVVFPCVSANAETNGVNNLQRMRIADGPLWTYCINAAAKAHVCVLKPDPNQPCPEGYQVGGITWTTKAAACGTAQQNPACGGGADGC